MKPSSRVAKYQSGNLILKQTEELGPLILGDCNSAMDKRIQKEFNIQTVISIGQQAMPIKQKLPENCQHLFYDVHDNKSQKISSQLFDEVGAIIQQGRKKGGVLVHCYAGVSRSSTFVIAYIIQKFNKSYTEAKQEVKNARSCIHPNDGFVYHLKNYEKTIQKREQQRLRKLDEQKRLQMGKSLVQSARKSVRGGVKSADMSPEKVKQMAQQSKKKTYEIIVEPIVIIKQEPKQQLTVSSVKQTQSALKFEKQRSFRQSMQQKQRRYSHSLIESKSKIKTQNKKQDFKLPIVNQKAKFQYKPLNKYQKKIQQNKASKLLAESQKSEFQRYSSSVIEPNVSKQKIMTTKREPTKEQSHTSETKSTMRESKSVYSNTKKQKQFLSQIDETLLNDHEKKIKKIYEAKVFVK